MMATSSGGLMRKRWRIWNLALVLVAFGLNFSFGFYFNHEPSLRQHLPRKRIRSSKSQTGHDTDGIFVKEGDLMVSTGRFPLIGLPKFSPKFHVGVLLSSGEMMMDDTYLLFDFIPDKATEFTTAAALFRGQRVAGLVREKVLHFQPSAIVQQGRCKRSIPEIRAFCESYDSELHLWNNNCYTFVDRLLAYIL